MNINAIMKDISSLAAGAGLTESTGITNLSATELAIVLGVVTTIRLIVEIVSKKVGKKDD